MLCRAEGNYYCTLIYIHAWKTLPFTFPSVIPVLRPQPPSLSAEHHHCRSLKTKICTFTYHHACRILTFESPFRTSFAWLSTTLSGIITMCRRVEMTRIWCIMQHQIGRDLHVARDSKVPFMYWDKAKRLSTFRPRFRSTLKNIETERSDYSHARHARVKSLSCKLKCFTAGHRCACVCGCAFMRLQSICTSWQEGMDCCARACSHTNGQLEWHGFKGRHTFGTCFSLEASIFVTSCSVSRAAVADWSASFAISASCGRTAHDLCQLDNSICLWHCTNKPREDIFRRHQSSISGILMCSSCHHGKLQNMHQIMQEEIRYERPTRSWTCTGMHRPLHPPALSCTNEL